MAGSAPVAAADAGGAAAAGGGGGGPGAWPPGRWRALYINLDRRPDRRGKCEKLLAEAGLPESVVERVPAVDGAELDWAQLVKEQAVTERAARAAQRAERSGMPTICRETHAFSPHLTKSAVGCGLSHRKAWARVARGDLDYALVLEDDVSELCADFPRRCREAWGFATDHCPSWMLCALGTHNGPRPPAPQLPLIATDEELILHPLGQISTGLFAYLLKPSGARVLTQHAFPLQCQVDVMVSQLMTHAAHQHQTILALQTKDELRLAYSPKSEGPDGDTDVQTIWEAPAMRVWECRQCGQRVLAPAADRSGTCDACGAEQPAPDATAPRGGSGLVVPHPAPPAAPGAAGASPRRGAAAGK